MIGRDARTRATRVERQAYKWVMKMLDDPGRHAAGLERWLSQADEHRTVFKRAAKEVGYASDAAVSLPHLRAGATPRQPRPARANRKRLIVSTGLAAAIALLVILGWVALAHQSALLDQPTTQLVALGAEGSRKTVSLDDGSIVTMSPGGRADVRFSGTERAIVLAHGHARFEVRHDPTRPFVVYVGGGKVTAVGTIFEINADRDVQVHLISGRIRVAIPRQQGSDPASGVILNSGEKVSFTPRDATEPVPISLSEQGPEDRKTIRSYDDVPAAIIVDQVNQHSPVKIVIVEPTVGARKVFAEIDVRNAESVARKLAALLDLEIDRSNPGELRLAKR